MKNRTIILLIKTLIMSTLITNTTPLVAKKTIDFESLYSFESLGKVALSPDNKYLVFSTSKSMVNENKSISRVWLMDVNGNNLQQISDDNQSMKNFKWIENGKKLAYLSSTENKTQVFTYDIETSNKIQITDYPLGINNFEWSTNGQGLVFVSDIYPENATILSFKILQY